MVGIIFVDFVDRLFGVGYLGGVVLLVILLIIILIIWYWIFGNIEVVLVDNLKVELFYWLIIMFL